MGDDLTILEPDPLAADFAAPPAITPERYHQVTKLLKQVRGLMASAGDVQAKLDQLVVIISQHLGCAVCSIYLRGPNAILELYSTQGLNKHAVHATTLKVGEGVVGQIAETAQPISLSDANVFEHFASRPETGESRFFGMMGVPILSGGRVIGVLAVQSEQVHKFNDTEIDALATIAMVISEMVIHHRLINPKAFSHNHAGNQNLRLSGQCLNKGIAMGLVVLHWPELGLHYKMVHEDREQELARLHKALHEMQKSLDALMNDPVSKSNSILEILRAYRVLADDKGWVRKIEAGIATGLSAEASVVRTNDALKARIKKITDPMMRERLSDLEDVANRLLRYLVGRASLPVGLGPLPEYSILVARNLDAAELLEYNPDKLKGVILLEGAASSHVAIVARAMGVPMIGKVKDALDYIAARDRVVVDATNGGVFINPSKQVRESVKQTLSVRDALFSSYAKERNLPIITKDSKPIELHINAGMLMDVPHLAETGAMGIGLFRTELSLMLRQQFPTSSQLTKFYTKIYDQAADKPIIFRSFDFGSDKKISYIPMPAEENPALGWRAIRYMLDEKDMLYHQAYALIAAANGRPLRFMFPMVTLVDEFIRAKEIVLRALEDAEKARIPKPNILQFGAMLEVPALAMQIPALSKHADFISIGSNDLAQFFFASDRMNSKLDGRYDLLNPGFLSFIHQIIQACDAHGLEVSLCGEMAAKPLEVLALTGLGLKKLSMMPSAVGMIRRLIRQVDLDALTDVIRPLLSAPYPTVRAELMVFAKDQKLEIETIDQLVLGADLV